MSKETPKATVREAPLSATEGKKVFELLLDDFVIGTSKLEGDAQLYAHKINEAIDEAGRAAYDEGYQDAIDSVASGE